MSYFALTTEQLEAEHDKQADVVSNASPDRWMDEWQKLSVLKSMLAWRAVEAARFGRGKRPAHKAEVSPREQAGRFEFGKKSRVFGEQCKALPSDITEKE